MFGSRMAADARPGLTRRSWLAATSAGLATSGLAAPLRLSGETPPARNLAAKAKSVILIFNCGAPSHLDLWDPKPFAPDNVRSRFATIDTNVPGLQVTELLPRMAQLADKLAVVRTLHHEHSAHNSGMYWSIVGRPYRINSTLINPSPSDYPSFGTLLGWLAQQEGCSNPLPPYVITPFPHCDSMLYLTPGQYGSCLGVRYDPFVLNDDPEKPDFRVRDMGLVEGVPVERVADRQALWSQLDQRGQPIHTPLVSDLGINQSKAWSLMTSAAGSQAFDLAQEPAHVRERYGRHSWGQSHLLARRLVEAGVRMVTTVNGPSITWDTHKDNDNRLKNHLVPPMEKAYAALLEDLSERGLLDSTLVIWMGDFGRTPIINNDGGRDHWPHCYSMILAGGGIRGGQVIGASDKLGGEPWTRPVTPADIHATIFTALGYDPHKVTYSTADGRPVPLSEGGVVRELLG